MPDPTVTQYGDLNPQAPKELRLFSFLVGAWDGEGKTRIEEGKYAEYKLTWVGRYILDGMAIADEMHSLDPQGNPYLGISLRSYNSAKGFWVIEYLNVSGSFLRKQVGAGLGGISQNGNTVTVLSGGGGTLVREHYTVTDHDHFTYSLDMSKDDGKNWDEALIVMKLTRKP